MLLQEGKKYINCFNDEITVTLTHPESNFPFTGSDFCRYMADGRYIEDIGRPVNDLDLKEIL